MLGFCKSGHICSIVATLLWCSGMIICAIVCRNLHSGILNTEISQFCQRLGAMPPDPRIWDCLLGQTRILLLKSLRTALTIDVLEITTLNNEYSVKFNLDRGQFSTS